MTKASYTMEDSIFTQHTSQKTTAVSEEVKPTTPKVQIPYEILNAQYLFVRHAEIENESEANVASKQFGKISLSNSKLYDARLTQNGIKQCEESITRDYLHQTELEYVMVSPMRRAMQTAYHLLKEHP